MKQPISIIYISVYAFKMRKCKCDNGSPLLPNHRRTYIIIQMGLISAIVPTHKITLYTEYIREDGG